MKCRVPINPITQTALDGNALETALNDPNSPRCGYELDAGDEFCPSCGAKVGYGNKADNSVSSPNAQNFMECWRREVPRPDGDIATFVVYACASLLGAVVCYILFAFGGFGQTGSCIMAICVALLVAQMPKQVFGAYALMTINAGGKVIVAQKIVIYACAGALIYFPWGFPAYGAAMALYEINKKCVIDENDGLYAAISNSELRRKLESRKHLMNSAGGSKRHKSWRVSLDDYYKNCRTMNVFSRSAYKKVYQLYFGKENL